jgi:hypothetical protein
MNIKIVTLLSGALLCSQVTAMQTKEIQDKQPQFTFDPHSCYTSQEKDPYDIDEGLPCKDENECVGTGCCFVGCGTSAALYCCGLIPLSALAVLLPASLAAGMATTRVAQKISSLTEQKSK